MAEIHASYKESNELHDKTGDYEGGACLVKHVTEFVDADSCSYRWQGVKKAGMEPGKSTYNAHGNPKHHVGAKSTGAFEPNDTARVEGSPGMAGLVVGITKNKLYNLVKITNFTTGSVPYSNQVHHVLNASSLRGGIDAIAEIWGPIREVIINGLLTEKYNLNHHDNNIILPTGSGHCRKTGLPKHRGAHPGYSSEILGKVKIALTPYETIANQLKDKEEHDPPDPKQLKKDFVAISNTMYASIITLAATNRASNAFMTINNLPASAFATSPAV
jgi:hypothetical protein